MFFLKLLLLFLLFLMLTLPCIFPLFQSQHILCNSISNSHLWHFRLGHPSMMKLTHLQNDLGVSTISDCKHCHTCHLAKQKKLPFPISNFVTSSIFQLIHCGIWGPFQVQTMQRYKYFFTIVNDFSRFTWVYLLKQKSDVLDVFLAILYLCQDTISSSN